MTAYHDERCRRPEDVRNVGIIYRHAVPRAVRYVPGGTVCRQDSRLLRHVSAQPAAIIETASTPTGTIEVPVAAMDWFLSLPSFLSASLSVFGFWPSPGVVVPGSHPDPDSGWDPGQDQASASGQDRDQDQASDPGRDRLSPSP